MFLSLSTRWNACRYTDGEPMIEEILELGFEHVELGYDLTMDLVPGVLKMVKSGAVKVSSVHAFCPVPVGAPQGHPELFSLASTDSRMRASAFSYISKTVDFAAQVGARTVVLHAGNVDMPHMTRRLLRLAEDGGQFSPRYERLKTKLMMKRDKRAPKQIKHLYNGVERLLPVLENAGVTLAMENLPSWESLPTESEAEALITHFGSSRIRYWHDIGHGQIRQNLGFVAQVRWLERLAPYLAGMHVHDVAGAGYDHIMPPKGDVNFSIFDPLVKLDIPAVLEPTPQTPVDALTTGIKTISEAWGL